MMTEKHFLNLAIKELNINERYDNETQKWIIDILRKSYKEVKPKQVFSFRLCNLQNIGEIQYYNFILSHTKDGYLYDTRKIDKDEERYFRIGFNYK